MVDTVGLTDAVSGAPSYSGRKLRQLNAVGFAGATSARPLGARSGVRPGTPSTTVTASSTTWTCQPFAGLLDGQTAAEAGPYPFSFDAVATGAVTAANASNPRIDIVYVQVDDPSEDASSVPAVTRKYLAGTAAAVPAAPATPAGCMVIAQINVPKVGSGSPTVTWVAPYLAAAGGVVHFRNAAERDAETSLAVGQLGEVSQLLYVWDGSAWVAVTAKARGRLKGVPAATVNLVGSTITPLTTGLETDYEENVTAGSGTLTIVKAGRYRLKAGYVVLPNATGQRNVYITKNNTTASADVLAFGMDDGSAAGFASPTAEGVATLAAGDVIRLLYYQNSSGTLGLRTISDTVAGIYLEVEEM